ncbi:MAG: isochorismatase family protein [Chloroflexi bacterium]|nr:isochorismatase family protein [Chloroflexota bacterium]
MRKWEEVFPEVDRQIYAKAGMSRREAFGRKPAVLIIDVVESFTGSRPENVLQSIEEYSTSCGDVAWKALNSIKSLLDAGREAGVPVVYTKGDATNKYHCGDSTKGLVGKEILRVHNTPIPAVIAPLPSEYVLRKTRASAFFGTPLATYFHRLGVDCLIVGGTSTSGCVRASVIDAYSHGYTVFLVEECCFDRSEFSHLVNLFEMNAKYANVITVAEALDYLKGQGGAVKSEKSD